MSESADLAYYSRDTQDQTPRILRQVSLASRKSTLYRKMVAPAPNRDIYELSPRPAVRVVPMDTLTAALEIESRLNESLRNTESSTDAMPAEGPKWKIGILNMADKRRPGGGWLEGGSGQEDDLCRRSTLAVTLKQKYYPLPLHGAIWSPRVAIFREVGTFRIMPTPLVVGVVSMAALAMPSTIYCGAEFDFSGDILITEDKIRQVLRVLAWGKVTHCVLGALGCGGCKNPPEAVAELFEKVLDESEWGGVFEEITFAIGRCEEDRNFEIFNRILGE